VETLRLRPFRDRPIAQKITLVSMLASVVALLLASLSILAYEIVVNRDVTYNRLQAVGTVVAHNTAAALAFDDPEAATDCLSGLRAERSIVATCVYRTDGSLFASQHDSGYTVACPRKHPENVAVPLTAGRRILSIPIRLEEAQVGSLLLYWDTTPMLQRLARYAGIVLLVMLVPAAMTYLLARRLQSLISDPILDLVETSRRVSASRDYALRASEGGADEIGLLITSYNEMLEQIQARDHDLERHRDHLDQEVQTRTSELLSAVEELQDEIHQREKAEEQIRRVAL
jgi:methyl-accepting chemotaxis protein